MRKIPAALTLFALLCVASTAWSDRQRVAVLQPEDELLRAIALSLAPWGLETIPSDAALPGQSQPDAVREASQLAQRLEVRAMVWITRIDDGSLLWVFDASTGDVTTRLLTESPPFDSAGAAAVALSVKTVLRASPIAPPDERFEMPWQSPLRRRTLGLEGGGGAYWIGEGAFDPRGKLSMTGWLAAAGRLGLTMELSLGPGMRVTHSAFSGRYREVVLGAGARLALWQGARFETVLALGGSAHWTSLRGTLGEASLARSVNRVNVAVDLQGAFNFYVGSRAYLGLAGAGAYFPRYRRYLSEGDPIFAPFPLVASLTAHGGVEF